MQPALNQHVRSDLPDVKVCQVEGLAHQCRRGSVCRGPSGAEQFRGHEGPDLVDQATYRGVLLVAAMNNERKRTIPSEYAGVFSVACAPGTDREEIWCNPAGPATTSSPATTPFFDPCRCWLPDLLFSRLFRLHVASLL